MKKRKIFLWFSATVLLVFAALFGAAWYLVDYALLPDEERRDTRLAYERLYERVPDMREWVDSVARVGALRDTFILMPDGRRAHALYMRSDSAHGRTAVILHGYKNTAQTFLYLGRMYSSDLDCNILLPDLYAHGLSDGEDVQMGWLDRLDVARWLDVAHSAFGNGQDSVRIVLHGVSMGAATTMCVSGERLPDYVRCFVEDCGYTSTSAELGQQLEEQFHLPRFPLLPLASGICKMRFGWAFGDGMPLQQVARCSRPMLFIHGDSDTFVPTAFVYELYKAKPQPKQLWIAAGSRHAKSYIDHPAEYTRTVRKFLMKYL